jgi:hypothetical protein
MNIHSKSWLLAPLLVGACAADPAPPAGDLGAAVTLPIAAASWLEVEVRDRDGERLESAEPHITGGEVTVRIDGGALIVDAAVIELSDITVIKTAKDDEVPLELTGLRLRLADPAIAPATWRADRSRAAGVARAELHFDWGLRTSDGEVLPFASRLVRDLELGVTVGIDADVAVTAMLDAAVSGRLWNLGGLQGAEVSFAGIASEAAGP